MTNLPLNLTDYHACYLAHEITRRYPTDSIDKLAGAVASAQVDLNPHQVDAALFAFRSPFSHGALLADEVGLGKTIEAGLVIAQKWAERKRRILVITPSNLRKQWHQELSEKFFLPCFIIESKSYNNAVKQGEIRPFDNTSAVVICSYQFAKTKAADVQRTAWDLVVMDEAHRLRNVYKPNNIIANVLKNALEQKPKLLLTATPLQNSLLELYGLVSFIDPHAFGDLKSFREQFASLSQEQVFQTLRNRLKPLCHRTLRRQVTAYISYTKRLPMVEEFTPEESEDRLYELVSEYLQRENLQALPASQRTLMTLVLRKLLASSTYAIAGALTTISTRMKKRLNQSSSRDTESLADALDEDYEVLDELVEEWDAATVEEPLTESDRKALEAEVKELEAFTDLAVSITHNAKGQKAIIFTESRKTQNYLLRLLADSPFAEGIVLFNGSNTDDGSKKIYVQWLEKHRGTDRVTGSKTADMRSALVDYFREEGKIMIATEAGAEGINLQFCSLVVNYDLPWNPQRIEQRIGRCHRYGQKHDVVVVNFLNRKNEADKRVYELLSEKFQLFEGVFGASDEVLGAIESGVDFEKRIAEIYQGCRRPDEIKAAFDDLQLEMNFEINEAMTRTRQQLLENFDDEVREKLRVQSESSQASLTQFETHLMALTRHALTRHATFEADFAFQLHSLPFGDASETIPLGRYELPRRSPNAHTYRLNHPLAETLITECKARNLPPVEMVFDYGAHTGRISVLEPLRGQSGWLSLSQFTVEALEQAEDHLIFSAMTDSGEVLEAEIVQRLLSLPSQIGAQVSVPPETEGALERLSQAQRNTIGRTVSERNAQFFEQEAAKLDAWADDLKVGLERDIKEIDRQIKEARRSATVAVSLEEKLAGQKQVKALEVQRSQKRRSLFDAQDAVDAQREELISEIEGRMAQNATSKLLFIVYWNLL
jgi:ERCC4-related helicase